MQLNELDNDEANRNNRRSQVIRRDWCSSRKRKRSEWELWEWCSQMIIPAGAGSRCKLWC